MSNSQIKFTLTDDERTLLEQQAQEKGMSVSALVHEKVFGAMGSRKDYRILVDNGPLKEIHLHLPLELYTRLRKDADTYGYSFSRYVTILLFEKGDPVLIRYDHLAMSREIAALHRAYKDFAMLARMAVENGNVNAAEIHSALLEFAVMKDQLTDAICACSKKTRELLPMVQLELSKELKLARMKESLRDTT